ncbi:hypothetical protein HanRHA438_Chr03g0137801 [Helianthus annuus]|nr:hypothetical protein HanRHA438_Chr03g0137801 [Helianthus annuus]
MTEETCGGDFSLDLLNHALIFDLIFVDDFNGDAFAGGEFSAVVDLGEGAGSDEFSFFILASW